jgi:hypothetical protein
MTLFFEILLLLFGLAATSAAAAENVILRTSTEPEESWVGQRVRLNIEVLGADGWAQIPDLPAVEIPGAYVMRTESQGVRLSETIARTTYTGQRYQLSVYCQRPGQIEIPPLPVTAVLKQWGVNAAETPYKLTTPATPLICKVPPGAEGIRGLISTTHLDAEQTWSSRPETAAPGDAITRTITMSADDVSAMAFPPMQHSEIEGVAVYPGQPSVNDETNRGDLRGRREESVTYVFEEPGDIALPEIVLSWWDIQNQRLRRIELPGLEIAVEGEITPEPAVEPEVAAVEQQRDLVPLIASAVVLIVVGLWLGIRLGRWYQTWRRSYLESEVYAYRHLNRALRSRDPKAISASIMRWLDRLDPGTRPARLDLFLEDHGGETTQAAAATLSQSLASGEPFAEARALARGLKKARNHLLRSRHAVRQAERILPELNGPSAPPTISLAVARSRSNRTRPSSLRPRANR